MQKEQGQNRPSKKDYIEEYATRSARKHKKNGDAETLQAHNLNR